VPVEMWKTDLNVVVNEIVFHSGCGKCCGNLYLRVEKMYMERDIHISTAH
jgi:hypothetical protein